MIRIAVCDDNKESIAEAKEIISEVSKNLRHSVEIDSYQNGEDIINRLLNKKEPLDILVLDVDMPGITGLELAKKLRIAGEQNLIIIFLSAHDEFVFDSIEFVPLRYVRKTLMETQLPLALFAAFNIISANADKEITLKTENGEQRVLLSQIMYYEVYNRKIAVYLKNGAELVVGKTLKELQEIISDKRFVLLHRACVVNISFVKNVTESTVILDDDQKLVVSRRRIKEVKDILLDFWGDLI